MLDRRAFLALFVVAAVSGSATAGLSRESSAGAAEKGSPSGRAPQIDGPVTTLAGPDGRLWAAWAYRASGEFDIAVSSRDASATAWNAPLFLGRRDGVDETDPALTIDPRGNVYVAFTVTNPSRVAVAVLPVGSSSWSKPTVISGTEVASSPALVLVGDRLIVAYRTLRGVGVVDLPVFGNGSAVDGIQDGPDGVDGLGVKDHPQVSSSVTPDPWNLGP
jgi:hypothetical protein